MSIEQKLSLEQKLQKAMEVAEQAGIEEYSFVMSVIKTHVRKAHYAEEADHQMTALTNEGKEAAWNVLHRLHVHRHVKLRQLCESSFT